MTIYKVLLVACRFEREIKTLIKIKDAIENENRNIEVEILDVVKNSFITDSLDFFPDVILTYPFNAISTSYKFYLLKYLLNCHIITYQVEGILIYENEQNINFMLGIEKYGNTLVDYHIFWGEKTAKLIGDRLLKQGKLSSSDRILHVGWPYFEDYFFSSDNDKDKVPEYIFSKISKRNPQRNILFVSGFMMADYSDTDIFRAGDLVDTHNKNESEIKAEFLIRKEMITQLRKFRSQWIDTLIECAKKFPHFLFINKVHPLEFVVNRNKKISPYEKLKKYSNILLIEEYVPFYAIISYCSLLFHYGSTTMLESYISKVPTVSLQSKYLPNDFDYTVDSTFVIDISDIIQLLEQHSNAPISFKQDLQVEKFLKEQLDIDLTKNIPYNPSQKIAKIIISSFDKPPQKIMPFDPFLTNALQKLSKNLIQIFMLKAIEFINNKSRDEALEYLVKVEIISDYSNIKVKNLYYLRGVCYLSNGNSMKALYSFKNELRYFPDNEQSKLMLRHIELTL